MARLRVALSVAGVIGVIGVVTVGGFWFLRGPVLAAGADALLAAESLFMSGADELPLAVEVVRPVEPASVVDAGTITPIKSVLVR